MTEHLTFLLPFLVIILLFFIVTITIVWLLQKHYFNMLEAKNRSTNDEFKNHMKELNNEFLKEVMEYAYKSQQEQKHESKYEKDLFNTFVKLRNSIKEYCIMTMESTGACRLAVYLFHNGNHSTHGIKFFKMSCICEKVLIGSGIKEQSIEHSNIPINLFDSMVDNLINNGRYVVMNDDDTNNTNHRIFISSPKIKYSQAISIFDSNNNILGFVLAEMDHPYDRQKALEEKEKIDVLVNQLIPILSYSEYVNTAIEQQNGQHE